MLCREAGLERQRHFPTMHMDLWVKVCVWQSKDIPETLRAPNSNAKQFHPSRKAMSYINSACCVLSSVLTCISTSNSHHDLVN